MPLREWGLGLEALTECYFKYITKCVVERGRAYQVPKLIHYPGRKQFSVPYPAEIDLIAVSPGSKQVTLITCKEDFDEKIAKETLRQFAGHRKEIKQWLGFRDGAIFQYATYVKATKDAKKILKKKGFVLLSAGEMISQLINYYHEATPGRKGVQREPILWLLQTLDSGGLLK